MWKRIGAYSAIVLAVLMTIISVVCIFYLLNYRQPVIDTTAKLLEQADVALTVASDSAERAVALSGEVQSLVDETQSTLNEAVEEASARTEETIAEVQASVTERFGTQVRTAVETIAALVDSYRAAQDLAASLSRLPGLNVELPGSAAAAEIAQNVENLQTKAAEVSDNVERITAIPGEAVDTANASLDELSETVAEIESTLSNVSTELSSTQEAVRRLQENHARTINLAVTILCLILVWTIISQFIVIRWAWNVTREIATV